LEDLLVKTTVAMVDIQKQVYRGEETYYEDTHAHGNIFRGWDAYVDSKDLGAIHGTSAPPQTSRRVPGDSRWFSGSCRSVSRSNRPAPLNTMRSSFSNNNSRPPSSSNTPTNTPTNVASAVSSRSETGTPTSTQSKPTSTEESAANDKSTSLQQVEIQVEPVTSTTSQVDDKAAGSDANSIIIKGRYHDAGCN
jgi:hypothetical protein